MSDSRNGHSIPVRSASSSCSHWHRGKGSSNDVASLWSYLNALALCNGEVFLLAKHNQGKNHATAEGFHLHEDIQTSFGHTVLPCLWRQLIEHLVLISVSDIVSKISPKNLGK